MNRFTKLRVQNRKHQKDHHFYTVVKTNRLLFLAPNYLDKFLMGVHFLTILVMSKDSE